MKLENLPAFIPGLELCEAFYGEAVRPVLDRHFPDLKHAAARLDHGSDVLRFDTPQSRDHGWGPKVTVFLTESDYEAHAGEIRDVLGMELPFEIRGYPTNFDQPFHGEGLMVPTTERPVNHWVALTTMSEFFTGYLGVDPDEPVTDIQWLTMPQQHLRTVASGVVFHDGLGRLEAACETLRWYPDDLWLYLLANQWRRIDQEEPFMARCGDTGDELGSRVVAARLVTEIMRLCLLMEKAYWPYNKWFGRAFSELACGNTLTPILVSVFEAQDWQQREARLSEAYLYLGEMHNELELTETVETRIANFFNRPYRVPHSGRFVEALHAAIQSEAVRALDPHLGAVDQFVDSTDVLSSVEIMGRFDQVFRAR